MSRALNASESRWAGGALWRSAGFVALSLLSTALSAQQVRSSVVLGGVRIRYADALEVSALTFSPAVTLQSGANVFGASGTVSQPSLGSWSGQFSLAGSTFRPLRGPVAVELGANGVGSTTGDGARTGHVQAQGRAHLISTRAGMWAGTGLGSTWSGASWQTTRVGELGVWGQGDAVGALVSWSPIVANDSVRYTDLLVALRWRGRRLEVDGTLGQRSGAARATNVADPSAWASVSASWRVSARTAIVASGGTYPLDLLQGFPSGRFASVGVRLTGPGSGASPEFAREPEEIERDRLVRGVSALRVRRVGAGRFELRLRASGASRMEITGDLTGWEPVPMRAEPDGWWVLALASEPGTYEITVRRDGGAWLVPPGSRVRRDEFGGQSGLLTLR
jgi:hypothetical protein